MTTDPTPAQRAGAPGRGEPGDIAAWIAHGKPRWWHEHPPSHRLPRRSLWRRLRDRLSPGWCSICQTNPCDELPTQGETR